MNEFDLYDEISAFWREVIYVMYQFGYGNMMGGSFLGSIVGLIVIVDLILLGIWLWKQIQKK